MATVNGIKSDHELKNYEGLEPKVTLLPTKSNKKIDR